MVRGRLRARGGEPDVDTPLAAAAEWAGLLRSLQRTGPVVAARAEARWLAGGSDEDPELVETLRAGGDPRAPVADRRARLLAVAARAARRAPVRGRGAVPAARRGATRRRPARRGSRSGCPYEAADAWADTADEGLLRRALETFTGLGAAPGRRRVERRLRELGVRSIPRGPVPSTREQPDGLTAREAEVLRWVRAGDTDAEIAERLFLLDPDRQPPRVGGAAQDRRAVPARPAARVAGASVADTGTEMGTAATDLHGGRRS